MKVMTNTLFSFQSNMRNADADINIHCISKELFAAAGNTVYLL